MEEEIIYFYNVKDGKYYQSRYTHRWLNNLQNQVQKQKEVIDKAIETLEKGITFCENDSQGIYNKCNIAINREKKVLDILKEVE